MLQRLPEAVLKSMARARANEITIRATDTSRHSTREATPAESTVIYNIIYSALLTINYSCREQDRDGEHRRQTTLNSAEFTVDVFLPECNGYDTVYNPLREIIADWPVDPAT